MGQQPAIDGDRLVRMAAAAQLGHLAPQPHRHRAALEQDARRGQVGLPVRQDRGHLDLERRRRRLAVLIAVLLVGAVTLLLSAFGGSGSPTPAAAAPASAARLLPEPLVQIITFSSVIVYFTPIKKVLQRSILPLRYQSSTFDARRLHFQVRNVTECFPSAIVTRLII